MVTIEISAQEIQNLLLDFESKFESIERLEFFRGKLFFSLQGISGCLEIRHASNALVFVIPVRSLVIEPATIQAFWAFAPKAILDFLGKLISDSLGIPNHEFIIQKTKDDIEIHLMNEFIWDKLDLEFLPRKLKLVGIKSDENGIRLSFSLDEHR